MSKRSEQPPRQPGDEASSSSTSSSTCNPLLIIGMGAQGMHSLTVDATRALFSADIIYTSSRLARMLPEPLKGKVRHWPVPFNAMVEEIAANRRQGRTVAVLATGNPFYYGVGSVLARHFDVSEIRTWPAPSCFSLAATRLGWPLQDIWKISLHGRHTRALEPYLVEGSKIFLLTEPNSLRQVAQRLQRRMLTGSRIVVLADLGGEQEAVHELTVEQALTFDDGILALPHVIALDCQYEHPETDFHPLACSRAPGLADTVFEHDGQITKAPIRAITISALMPRPRTCLWDIGAGCGSVAIEWLRMSGHTAHAVAIESDARRCEMMARNADVMGAAKLRIVHGRAPAALAGLPQPDVIFLGGGVADDAVFEAAWQALPKGGWLVANAVSLQAEHALLARHARLGGELMRIQIAHAEPLGSSSPATGAESRNRHADDRADHTADEMSTAMAGMAEERAAWPSVDAPATHAGGYSAFRQSLPLTQWRVRKA